MLRQLKVGNFDVDNHWHNIINFTGESSINLEDSVEDRRASFVDSLLNADGSNATSSAEVRNNIISEEFQQIDFEENENSAFAVVDPEVRSMFFDFSLAALYNQPLGLTF